MSDVYEIALKEKEVVGLMQACKTYYLVTMGLFSRALFELPGKRDHGDDVHSNLAAMSYHLVGPDRHNTFNIMDPAVPEDARIAFDLHEALGAALTHTSRPPFTASREVSIPHVRVVSRPYQTDDWYIELTERHADVVREATAVHAGFAEGDLSPLRLVNYARQPGYLPQEINLEEAWEALDTAALYLEEEGSLSQSRGSKLGQSAAIARNVHQMVASPGSYAPSI